MIFKTLPKETIKKALEGQEDVLGKAVKEHEAFFKRLSCVSCGSEVMPIVNSSAPFKKNEILPNYLAHCKNCGVVFEPYTGIQITLPR